MRKITNKEKRTKHIALTGASSVGKTTLAQAISKHNDFSCYFTRLVEEGVRDLLSMNGYFCVDNMELEERRQFQKLFFEHKRHLELELVNEQCLIDRSFVDIAAICYERDYFDEMDELLVLCKENAKKLSFSHILTLWSYSL